MTNPITLLEATVGRYNALKYKILYKVDPKGSLWDFNEPHPPLVELLDRNIVTVGRALDVGCGLGTQSIYLAERDFSVDGIDFQEKPLAQARTSAREAGVDCNFEWADVTQAGSRGPYDLILDRGCCHNLSGRALDKYSQNLKNWLAPGGYLQLTAFVWESWLERLTPTFTPKLHSAGIVRLFNWLELVETEQLSESEFGQSKMFCYLFRAAE